jgi:hypothetical protein
MSYILSQMRCCNPQPAARHGLAARPWRSTGACVGSGTILLLLPKCPLCIAAYIAVWTGAGMAASIAGYLRYVAIAVFLTSLIFSLSSYSVSSYLKVMAERLIGKHEKSL